MVSLVARYRAVRRLGIGSVNTVALWAKATGVRGHLSQCRRFASVLAAGLVLSCGLIFPQNLAAQDEAKVVLLLKGPDRSTPQAWTKSFTAEAAKLDTLIRAYGAERTAANLQAYSGQLEVLHSFFDLDAVPAAYRMAVGNEATVQMIDILNRLPTDQLLAADAIAAKAGAAGDVWALPGTDIILIRRQQGTDAGNFVMSQDVIARLPDFRDKVMSLPLLREPAFSDMRSAQSNLTGPYFPRTIAASLSRWLDATLLGVPSWKLFLTFIAVLATIAGNLIVYRIVRTTSRLKSANFAAWLGVLGPLTLAASFFALTVFCQTQLILQGSAALVVIGLRNLCVIVAASWAILSVVEIVSETVIRHEDGPDKEMDVELTRLIGKIIGVAGAAAVFAFGLGTLGVPTAGIITSLGVGGVGIAFAARVTMENLFGGLLLLIDRPFRIGDHIKIKDGEGVVTNIGVRSCRIVTVDGNTLTIPNGVLSASGITKVQLRGVEAPASPESEASLQKS